ncbi:hypothetical protein [Staphylococcus succinus]|uniref:hypothetical protein n=1 Tax=Staphylococcus succinus TaxID=61015 RepID=UPI000E67B052|nr:hypothetical protein [Staphylococcus succinus]RIN27714.1 hypothetical protein BU067_01525 [Staphylococcus succinus]
MENDFNNLKVSHIHVKSNVYIYLVPVIAPFIKDEKKKDNAIKNFKQTLSAAQIVRSFDLKIDSNNEVEPFKDFSDLEYAITDLNSLGNIKENKRYIFDLGFRFYIPSIDENKLFQINEDLVNEIDNGSIDSINTGVNFNQLQNLNDELSDVLSLTINYKSIEALEEKIDINLFPVVRNEEKTKQEQETIKSDESKEQEDVKEQETIEFDKAKEQRGVKEVSTKTQEIPNIQSSNESEMDRTNNENLSVLKEELYSTISGLIPEVYLDYEAYEFNGIVEERDYDEDTYNVYSKLEKLSVEEFQQAKRDRLIASNKRRNNVINTIYENLLTDVWTRSLEADTVINFESDKSTYNLPYKEIENKFEETKNLIPQKVEEYKKKLAIEFEKEKNYRAEKAKRDMEEKIENEERPVLEQRVFKYESELNQKATNVYNKQIDTLKLDVQHSWQLQYSKIVDEVINKNRQTIEQKATDFKDTIETDLNKTLEDRTETIEKLRSKIKDLEEARINDEQNFKSRVAIAVKEQINDYELKDTQMNDEIAALRSEYQKSKNLNTDTLEEVRRLKAERDGDKEEIKRLNERLLASQQETFNTTKEAMDIQKMALSNIRNPIASNNSVVNNNLLPKDVLEKDEFLQSKKKKGVKAWLAGLLTIVVLGSNVGFNAHSAQAQKLQEETNKKEQKAHQKKIEEQQESLEQAKEEKIKAEEQVKAEKDKAEKQAKAEKTKKNKKDKEKK